MASWLGLAALGAALVAFFAIAIWCADNWELVCFRKEAFLWRNGFRDTWLSGEGGHLYAIDRYMQAHWRDLTEDDVRGLLGEPTFTVGQDGRQLEDGDVNDWANIPEWLEELGLKPNGTEHVLWYDYRASGDTAVPDESYNIFFFVRNGKVLQYHTLA